MCGSKCLWLLHPILIVPNRMSQEVLDERRPSQCTRQWQMALRSLFHVVDKLGRTKPTLFSFHFAVGCCPPNFATKLFKVPLGLLPFAFLYGEAKFATRKLAPKTLDGCQVCIGDVLDIGKVDKVAAFGLGPRNHNESITGKLTERESKQATDEKGKRRQTAESETSSKSKGVDTAERAMYLIGFHQLSRSKHVG
jgi:hypothetical protein